MRCWGQSQLPVCWCQRDAAQCGHCPCWRVGVALPSTGTCRLGPEQNSPRGSWKVTWPAVHVPGGTEGWGLALASEPRTPQVRAYTGVTVKDSGNQKCHQWLRKLQAVCEAIFTANGMLKMTSSPRNRCVRRLYYPQLYASSNFVPPYWFKQEGSDHTPQLAHMQMKALGASTASLYLKRVPRLRVHKPWRLRPHILSPGFGTISFLSPQDRIRSSYRPILEYRTVFFHTLNTIRSICLEISFLSKWRPPG